MGFVALAMATIGTTQASAQSTATTVAASGSAAAATASMLPRFMVRYGSANGAATALMSSPAAIIAQTPMLFRQAFPLAALVEANAAGAPLDTQGNCLATAVYFEAMGESLEGQLAVANVVMNRAKSDKYPTSWCEVVKQPWQFSFVRNGQFPQIRDTEAWRKAQAIARIAALELAAEVPSDVLWYHADYVAPSWGTRLNVVNKIGAHIFYRA